MFEEDKSEYQKKANFEQVNIGNGRDNDAIGDANVIKNDGDDIHAAVIRKL